MVEDNERFVRWQQVTREQLGFTNYTVLALAMAALGFVVAQSADGGVASSSRFQICVLPTVVAFLVASHVFAIWCALNRLWDFRDTAKIVRSTTTGGDVAEARKSNKARGRRTWCLLYLQIGTFALSVALFLIASGLRAMQWV